jgi:hypothetical protein
MLVQENDSHIKVALAPQKVPYKMIKRLLIQNGIALVDKFRAHKMKLYLAVISIT